MCQKECHATACSKDESSGPMDLVFIDFLKMELDSQGYENVLMFTDHFTRMAKAFVTRNQKAETVAKILWENVFMDYGFPRYLHSDQGRDFQSKVIKQLYQCEENKKLAISSTSQFSGWTLQQDIDEYAWDTVPS